MRVSSFGAAAGVLLCVSCFAQSVSDTVVVTAARWPQAPGELVRPVTVITAEDIARSGQQSLVEILQTLGGVEISRNGGYGQLSSVFIRGGNSNHTQVLIDGMRVSAATSGATAFEHIPPSQIERIEVLPGPASGLYGSDAIGGVIQIFTKGAQARPAVRGSAGAGTYGTYSANAGASGTFAGTTLGFTAGYFSTDGFSATKPSIPFGQHNPDKDGYRNWSASAKVAHRIGERHELGLTLFHSNGRVWFDSTSTTDDVSDQQLDTVAVYSRNKLADNWESLLRAGEGRDKLAIRGAFPSRFETRQPQLTWQNTVRFGPGTVVAGLEYLRQQIESNRAFAVDSRDVKSIFAGFSGVAGAHAWQLNARRDDNEQFGARSTGNAAYGYELVPGLRLRAAAGSAFKAPTFNDLYFPGFSNPNLQPERSHSREAGLDYRTAGQALTLTWFDNRVTDLIVFDSASGRPQNVSRARIRGTELGYRLDHGPFNAGARLTLQRPMNETNGKLLQRRARKHGSVNAGYSGGGWSFGGEVVASSARFDSTTEAPSTRLHGYSVVNLTASRALPNGWLLRVRWNNVANRDYEVVQHYNTPGSNVFVSLDLSL